MIAYDTYHCSAQYIFALIKKEESKTAIDFF